MNFLAHLYLSRNSPDLMVGNFIGDFVKGKAYRQYPEKIQQGIRLHREIDAFTDENLWVRKSKKRLVPVYRHYSAVIVDMFYDHFLASEWMQFHSIPLEQFTSQTYATLQKYKEVLPARVQYILPFMIKDNWLKSYATKKGIGLALAGMARRTRFTSHMENATEELTKYYDDFREEFFQFFPLLISYVEKWSNDNITPSPQ